MFYHAIVFLPLLGAIIAGIASLRQHHNIATLVSIAGVFLSLVLSCFAFVEIALGGHSPKDFVWTLELEPFSTFSYAVMR